MHKTEEHPPTAPVPLSAPLNPLPQPDWQHQLWPLPAPKASGQWSILVPRVAGEPRKDRGRSWPGSSRLDGEGHQGGSLGQLGGGRVLTAVGAGGGVLQCSDFDKQLSLRISKFGKGGIISETSLGGSEA